MTTRQQVEEVLVDYGRFMQRHSPEDSKIKPAFHEATQQIMDIIKSERIKAKLEEHKEFEEWLYDPDAGVGTIHDWSKDRINTLREK